MLEVTVWFADFGAAHCGRRLELSPSGAFAGRPEGGTRDHWRICLRLLVEHRCMVGVNEGKMSGRESDREISARASHGVIC